MMLDRFSLYHLARGTLSWVPPLRTRLLSSTGGSVSARYCYSVWLRHLVLAAGHGLRDVPEVVAELGPGDSLGMGLAAVLCGARVYHGLDVVAFAGAGRNRAMLEELIALFRARADLPGNDELPQVQPRLPSYAFPRELLSEERLARALEPARLDAIRAALGGAEPERTQGISIGYRAPWTSPAVIGQESCDLIFSQAVLEHVESPALTWQLIRGWLKPGGVSSNAIDFRCHETSRRWNGHWAHSDPVWRLMRGNLPWLINRAPRSRHLASIRGAGLQIRFELREAGHGGISRGQLAPRFRGLDDDDLSCAGTFLVAAREG
jgi:SAM-dependent methyltransferase